MAIREKNGRPTCTRCGYEWSAMLGDNEWPQRCECEPKKLVRRFKKAKVKTIPRF